MYGHADALLKTCDESGCTRPAVITLDDGRSMCAADAINYPNNI